MIHAPNESVYPTEIERMALAEALLFEGYGALAVDPVEEDMTGADVAGVMPTRLGRLDRARIRRSGGGTVEA